MAGSLPQGHCSLGSVCLQLCIPGSSETSREEEGTEDREKAGVGTCRSTLVIRDDFQIGEDFKESNR